MSNSISENNNNNNNKPQSTPNPTLRAPDSIEPTSRFSFIANNVWQWIHSASTSSPIQPICNLSTGFNEQSPPDFVLAHHSAVLQNFSSNQYAPITGVPHLKSAISKVYSPSHGRKLHPSEILIASGAQEALLSAVLTFLGPGDEAILLEPAFEMYVFQMKFSGAGIKCVPIRSPPPPPPSSSQTLEGGENLRAGDWKVDLVELEAAMNSRTKVLYFNNPQNPLGKVFDEEELRGIGELCVKHGIVILSDEVYERVVFDDDEEEEEEREGNGVVLARKHIPMTSLSEEIAAHTLTAVSMGKLFNATGWRVGFIAGPANLIEKVEAGHLVLAYASSTPAQEACAEGLIKADETNWWEVNRRDIAARVKTLSRALDEVGLNYVVAAGAWFLWVNIERIQIPEDYEFPEFITQHHNSADWKVCYFMIQEVGIASIPGTCFYSTENSSMGASFIRLGACKDNKGLELARERLIRLKPYISSRR